MITPETVLADSRMKLALRTVERGLPPNEGWDENKQALATGIIADVIAIVELLEVELAPLTLPEDRAAKVMKLKQTRIMQLAAVQAAKFSTSDPDAGKTALMAVAGIAIDVVVRLRP